MNVEELCTPDDFRRAAEEAHRRWKEAEAEWDAANTAYDQAYADWRFRGGGVEPVKEALTHMKQARNEKARAFLLAARIYQRADEVGCSLWPEGPTEDVLIHRLADLLQQAE